MVRHEANREIRVFGYKIEQCQRIKRIVGYSVVSNIAIQWTDTRYEAISRDIPTKAPPTHEYRRKRLLLLDTGLLCCV